MRKILIFGNSGSGKSTLAARIAAEEGFAHLDLDRLAWLPAEPPERLPISESQKKIHEFIAANKGWVIEGCYSDLLALAVPMANEAIFMNLGIDQCVANAKNRPWEPHKYESKEAQDANLEMLINWIKDYRQRNDLFSYSAHLRLYEEFAGKKSMIRYNQDRLSEDSV